MTIPYWLGGLVIQAPGYILYAMGLLLLWSLWYQVNLTKWLLVCWSLLMLIYSSPFPMKVLHQLEQEAKSMAPQSLADDFEGFVLLGGCFSLQHTKIDSERPVYNHAGSRLFDFVLLAKEWPSKKIVLTGTAMEAEQMKKELIRFGIDPSRIIVENQSKNTEDNAKKTFELIQPTGQWVLVTSAFHMKRSLMLFKIAGWSVIPWPVGYLTGDTPPRWWPHPANGWAWYAGVKELIGSWHLSVKGGGF